MVNGDPDVDSIFRLTSKDYSGDISFLENKAYIFNQNIFSQGNTQATTWYKPKLFHLLYIPITVSFRFCDILKMYIAQRCLWEYGYKLAVSSPFFKQSRNEHKLINDFRSEYEMYDCIEFLINDLLPRVKLSGEKEDLARVYSELYKHDIVKKEELNLVNEWLGYF